MKQVVVLLPNEVILGCAIAMRIAMAFSCTIEDTYFSSIHYFYCHNGSLSQPRGNPIATASIPGYAVSSDFNLSVISF